MDLTVAVFDVDGTLTVRDCVVPFAIDVAGPGRLSLGLLSRSGAMAGALAKRDRDGLKAVLARAAFAGRSVDEVESRGIAFAEKVYQGWMRTDVAERYRWHQDQGHVVVLVSASFESYLAPLGDLMEADAVLCTRLEVRDGIHTGDLDGPNCRGSEKVRRITQWCQESGVPLEAVAHAYGDSDGDEDMLALAEHSHRVDRVELTRSPT